jgi:hypothetical protein
MKAVGGSEIYNFPIHHIVHFYSRLLRKTGSNRGSPQRRRQNASTRAPRRQAPVPPPRRPVPPPRRPVPPARVPTAVRAFPRSWLASRCLERRERVVLHAARTRHTLAPRSVALPPCQARLPRPRSSRRLGGRGRAHVQATPPPLLPI